MTDETEHNFGPDEMPDWLPDDPCGEEAHQQVLAQSETVEQARATSYMAGYFDAEGSIGSHPGKRDDMSLGWGLSNRLQLKSKISQMAGVFDGEGCVSLSACKCDSYSHGHRLRPGVSMTQNQSGTVLQDIYDEYCSYHGVEYNITYRDARGHRSPTVQARINGAENIRKFLRPLLPVLHEKRRQAIIMIREILPRYENDCHLTRPGFIEMMRWKRELDREKPMSDDDRKYTVEYFEELWADELEEQQEITDFSDEEPEKVSLTDD
jgi:hypothetical protein